MNKKRSGTSSPGSDSVSETGLKAAQDVNIDQKLIEEGTTQLNSEIAVLEAWLEELKSSDGTDTEVIAARKSYSDMLQSRREMLSSLTQQARQQTPAD